MALRAARLLRFGLPLMIVALTTFTSALVAAMTFAARSLSRPIPASLFDTYADLFPGQPVGASTLEAPGYTCQSDPLPSPVDVRQRCLLSPETGLFRAIALTIVDGPVIRTEFPLFPDVLSVGDLILSFGQPEIRVGAILTRLNRSSRHAGVILPSDHRRLIHFQPVSLISFSF